METKDLMIGDLVRKLERGGYSIPVKIIAIYEQNADYVTEDGHSGCMSIHGFEPRKLNDNILRAVFPNTDDGVFWCWDDYRSENTGEDWFEVRIDNGIEDLTIGLRYVHELQHLLRLCGIEKEIEL